MERYTNLGGDSGVAFFEIKESSILIEFKDGGTYLYDYMMPGEMHVEEMKKLARFGEGLNEYINKHVRKNYAAKLK